MAEEINNKEIETVAGKPAEDWMARKWRPMMGWTYMATCVFDFVIAPIAWSMLQAALKQPITQWMPVTLQGAGLYHVAMGAVLGVAAYGRTQEKLGGASTASTTVGMVPSAPYGGSAPSPYGSSVPTPSPYAAGSPPPPPPPPPKPVF
jgi:hypothetical protein